MVLLFPVGTGFLGGTTVVRGGCGGTGCPVPVGTTGFSMVVVFVTGLVRVIGTVRVLVPEVTIVEVTRDQVRLIARQQDTCEGP